MSAPQNITIIDSRIGDIDAAIACLPAGERVFVIDSASDGLSQISALLAGIDGIAALHIVAHGSAGALYLGNGKVDAAALAAHTYDLAAIGRQMAPGGDILLYGCDVAAGAAGAAFIDAFGTLTGADIAASTDVTGAAALGGNWTLEARIGVVEAQSWALAGLYSTLDVINGTSAGEELTGTANDDIISGFGGADTISGLAGNDLIDGGTAADQMSGGLGDDTYYVDNTGDKVIEVTGEGKDVVFSTISIALYENVEDMTLLGTGPLSAIGNVLDNNITGNTGANLLNGGAGNDVLDGDRGADTLVGGLGNDTYVLDLTGDVVLESLNEGKDTVQAAYTYVLGANVENLILINTNDINGSGNTLANSLTGNSANNILTGEEGNDILDGGADSDTLIGGFGDDTYVIDQSGDVIIEQAGQGFDSVKAAFTYTLLVDFENLTLTGIDALNGTGNSVSNALTGNSGDNTLTGLAGNDVLDGGAGTDILIGGIGDDTYGVDSGSDIVTEQAGEGTDNVQSSVDYVLSGNIEDLTLTGIALIDGTGNEHDNKIIGNDGANTLSGLLGNDTLDGGKDADTLIGGLGDDIYIIDNLGDQISEVADEGTDTARTVISLALSTNVENLVLTGTALINGTGNSLNNAITGNSAANIIDGGTGADTMTGGLGGDTYLVDDAGDTLIETVQGSGTDIVITAISYALAANVDNLTLIGTADVAATGNGIANTIIGNSGANIIDGGAGRDTLDGAEGADLYIVGTGKQQYVGEIRDSGTTGTDEIRVTLTTKGQVSLGIADIGIERIVIGTGTGAIADATGTTEVAIIATKVLNALTMTGNAGLNKMTGTAFNDIIDGGGGIDRLAGGKGDDTYYVDDIKDRLVERSGEGTDTVYASTSFVMSKGVEIMFLTGTGDLSGTGSLDGNTIEGNSGSNLLDGGKGNDTLRGFGGSDVLMGGLGDDSLEGGSAADVFRFKLTPRAVDGFDTIVDFSSAEGDSIELAKGAFRGLGKVLGPITADQFWSGAGVDTVHDASDRILYNTTTGNLWYDPDGLGAFVPILIAQLGVGSHPALSFTDIHLIA